MKKTLAGSITLACLCMSSLAQTPEQLAAYKAAVQSQENFNRVQREAGMPEMDVPTFEAWLKAEEEKESSPAPAVSAAKQEDPKIKWEKKLENIRPQLCELKPVKDKSKPVRSAEAIKEKERLLKAAEKAFEKQAEIERKLDAIAAKHGVERTRKNAEGKPAYWRGKQTDIPFGLKATIRLRRRELAQMNSGRLIPLRGRHRPQVVILQERMSFSACGKSAAVF